MFQQTQVITLILAAFFNLVMSITISLRGWKNPIYKYFSLMTFFNVLWALGLLVFNVYNGLEIVIFFASFVYFSALLVVLNLFYFAWHFPFKIFNLKRIWQNLLTAIIFIYSLYFIFFYKQFIISVDIVGQNNVTYNTQIYLVYSVLLLILMLCAVSILFFKYFKVEKMFKKSILLVLSSVILGVVAGSYFNLFYMYVNQVHNYHLGPLFTLIINFTAFYLIFSKRDKQIKY